MSISSVFSASLVRSEICLSISALASAILVLNSAVLALNSSCDKASSAASKVLTLLTMGFMAFTSCFDLSPTNTFNTESHGCYVIYFD